MGDSRGVRLNVMQECKACLARARTGKASLALPAYYKYRLVVRISFHRSLGGVLLSTRGWKR